MATRTRAMNAALVLAALLAGHTARPASEALSTDVDLPPIAKPGRTFTQNPKFPRVESDPRTRWPAPIPKDRQEKCAALWKQVSRGDLKAAEQALAQMCRDFGNYRRPMNPSEGDIIANALVIVWENGYWVLANRYRREDMPEKAIPLERELVTWGSSWNEPRFAAQRLQQGLRLDGTLDIPPGPHPPDATIHATVMLRNDNDTTIRTHLELETVKGFDKAYSHETGEWNPISHPGSHLACSPEYDILISPHALWKRRILVSAHSLEHAGSYELRIATDCIPCRSNTAILRYTK